MLRDVVFCNILECAFRGWIIWGDWAFEKWLAGSRNKGKELLVPTNLPIGRKRTFKFG